MTNDFDWDADFRRNGMSDADQIIRVFALEQIKIGHDALEEMIERMLTTSGSGGIAIIIDNLAVPMHPEEHDDMLRVVGTRHYRLDPGVPFGRMYEFPSMAAYELWQERGRPEPV